MPVDFLHDKLAAALRDAKKDLAIYAEEDYHDPSINEALAAYEAAKADTGAVERRTFWKHESSDDYDEIARYSSEQACVDDCTEGDAVVRVDEARTVVYREPSLRAGWGKEVYTRAKGIVAAKKAADPPAPAKADEQTHPPSCSSYEGPYCDCGLAEYGTPGGSDAK